MTLYLIRHTSVGIPRGTCYGWTDVPVSVNFESEAAACKAQLAGIHFDRVYTSPLTRARKLADYCGYPDAIEEPRMKEMHMGDWEMQRFDEIKDPQLKDLFTQIAGSEQKHYDALEQMKSGTVAAPFASGSQQTFIACYNMTDNPDNCID